VVTIDLADDNLIDDLVTIDLAEEKNDATEDDDIPSHASVDFGDDPLAVELTDTDMAELSSADVELIVNEQLKQAAEHLTNEQSASSNEISTSDKLDDKIISGDLNDTDDLLLDELESSDFDSLLDEIAGSESPDKAPQVDINSDDLLTLQNDVALPTSNGVDIKQPDYLDIDTLLEQSDESLLEEEPYNNIDMDVGLGDFDDLLAGEDSLDVDKESEGFSAKLDLAKAYLEINDSESALKVIDDVIENGPSEVQNEAQSIKEQLAES
jgi:pilus assembly protein FimV